MEANYNATIEVVVRTVSPGWTIGHLRDDHILADFFSPDQGMDGMVDDGMGDTMNISMENDGESMDRPAM